MATTDLAVIKPGGFAALNQDPSELLEAFRVNLGDDKLSKFDLDKATVPGPGGKRWRVTRADGSTEDPETLTGVIVGIANTRTYYKTEYTGGGEAPDCSSYDGGRTGIGDPGGTCHDCPMNTYSEDSGPACAEGKHLLLLPDNAVLPMLVTVPPVSLRFVKGYMAGLANYQIKYWGVVTELTIGTTNTQRRKDVVCIMAKRVGPLDPAEAQRAGEYRDAIDQLIVAPTPPATPTSATAPAEPESDVPYTDVPFEPAA